MAMIYFCQATGTGTGNGTGNQESRIEIVPVLTVKSHGPPTHPPTHPTTFRGEGDKLQQSAFSKNVLG